MGQGVVAPHAPDHVACGTRAGAGGSSVETDTTTSVQCGTSIAALTERLFRRKTRSPFSSAGLPLQERDWLRPRRHSWS